MRLPLILCLGIGLAACTPTAREVAAETSRVENDQAELDRVLAGFTAGPPENCLSGIDRRISQGSRTIGNTVLYRISANEYARNDMGGGCNFRGDPIMVTQTPSTQLCRGDIVQLIDRASRFPIGSCAYGEFIRYRRVR